MNNYSRTCIQLLEQMQEQGYSESDLTSIVATYKLAMVLFSGQYRQSGNTFISHLVGTASILSDLHTSIEVIAAGLIHAAYTHGDFGSNWRYFLPHSKREYLKKCVGEKIENYVNEYSYFPWYSSEAIFNIDKNISNFNQLQKELVTMRLANELEDCSDRGLIYSGDVKYNTSLNCHSHLLPVIANKLGYGELARHLENAFNSNKNTEIPRCLEDQFVNNCFTAPLSYKKRSSAIMLEGLKKIKTDLKKISPGK